ncbi:response regulator, partial [Candidatus Methylomirabilis sp.]|uniref:response regulator n=1 Tax=Candidatus Methylomirabilis sp. TaxID=2032687 RepID=UPI003C77AD57
MPQGGTITVTTRHVADSEIGEARAPEPGTLIPESGTGSVREWVELTVTDTGVGMSPAIQARLFEPFFTTKGVRGTGLGLSMVHGIVSRHHGEVTAQSAEGQGTTITLRLPVARAVAEVVPPLLAPLLRHAPLKLLVIDDDPLLTQTLGELLRILGHEAAIATSGEEGLTRLAAERFDMVLTDLGMPEMSGWEVAQAVKARWPQLPVILVTGWGDTVEHDRLEGTGVDVVLAKPYTVAQLQHALVQGVALTRRGASEGLR